MEPTDTLVTVSTFQLGKRRGYQPPWYKVRVYSPCPECGYVLQLRVNWLGSSPPGAVMCACTKVQFQL